LIPILSSTLTVRAAGWVEPLRNPSSACANLMGFAPLDPSHALPFLMLAPLFVWVVPAMTRKELTDFVGEKVG
jgi:hypothetical protein